MGGPTPLLCMAFISTLVESPMTSAQQNNHSLAAKWSVLFLLMHTMQAADSVDLELWLDHFHIWQLPTPDDPKAMIQYHLKGTATLPSEQDYPTIKQVATMPPGEERAKAALALTGASYTMDQVGIPTATGKSVPLQSLLTAFLCQVGGVKESRAPRGGAFKAVKGGGKSKGKNQMDYQEVEASWDDNEW